MEFLLAYAAGLLTLINPCALPVLPIMLAGSLQPSRYGPLALAGGMCLAFVTLGFGVIAESHPIGLREETVSQAGAVLMVPQLSARFATATAGVASRADGGMRDMQTGGWQSQFLGGLLLGAVWSPCVGPVLGSAISLASQGEELLRAYFIMLAFALGIGTLIITLGYGARTALQKRMGTLRAFAAASRPFLGAIFFLTGLAI